MSICIKDLWQFPLGNQKNSNRFWATHLTTKWLQFHHLFNAVPIPYTQMPIIVFDAFWN